MALKSGLLVTCWTISLASSLPRLERCGGTTTWIYGKDCMAVDGLFLCSGPMAIRRLISTVVVFAINAMGWTRPRSHIGNEIGKGLTPAVADCDPSTAVPMVPTVGGLVATLQHMTPDPVFRGTVASMRQVKHADVLAQLRTVTAAAPDVAIAHSRYCRSEGVSTVTLKQVISAAWWLNVIHTNAAQPLNDLTRVINANCHAAIIRRMMTMDQNNGD